MAFLATPTDRVSKLMHPSLLAGVEPVRSLARAQMPHELTSMQREAVEAMVMILWTKFHSMNGDFYVAPHIDKHLQMILEKSGKFLGSDYVGLSYAMLDSAFRNAMMPEDMPNFIEIGRAAGVGL